MLAPISLLQTFVDIKDPHYIAQRLSINGLESSIKTFGIDIKNVKVGEVISIKKHEDLNLCKVFVGDTTLDIITAASNVYEGVKVPVALPEAKIKDVIISPKTIKGILSQGMMLSISELGIDDNVDGILIFDNDVKVGEDVSKLLDFGEIIFECETTPNRGDLLSILGIAREISIITNSYLAFDINMDLKPIDIDINITTNGCHKYVGSILKGVKVKSSRLWLRKALWKMGLKSISNAVDITNYTMMMLGQPLHAFDFDKITTPINIRQAKKDEFIKALDKKDYALDESIMVIADKEKPIAIAGVMGGFDTGVGFETSNIFLESALFDYLFVRKASKQLKLSTDASYRFERGVDIDMSLKASMFALKLFLEETQASIEGYKEVIHKELKPKKFFLSLNDYVRYTDLNFDKKEISDILNILGFKHYAMRCGVEFEVPSYRYYDIDSSIDLIEEIVKVKDFNNFEVKPMPSVPTPHYEKDYITEIKYRLTSNYLTEVINLSFDKIEDYEELGLDLPIVEVKNPILPSFRFLRRYLTPSMLRLARQNVRKHIKDFAIFEISHIFDEDREHLHVCMLLKGDKRTYPNTQWNIHHLKELAYLINEHVNFGFSEYKFLHPYQQGNIYLDNEEIGFFGKVLDEELEDTFLCEFRFYAFKSQKPCVVVSKYPPVVRDISLILDMDFDIQKLIILIREYFNEMLEDVKVFDFYKGEQIEEDKKSVGLRLVLRAYNKSLEDEEVNKLMEGLLERLEDVDIKLRFS